MKILKGLEYKSCEEQLRELWVFSGEKEAQGDHTALYNSMKGCGKVGVSLLTDKGK